MSIKPQPLRLPGPAGAACQLAVQVQGDAAAPVVFMAHSILSASVLWDEQAALLAENGFRVVRADTRGHGASDAPAGPYAMDDLVADVVAVLDALGVARAHFVGLSLGGMTGFGLGIHRADRLLSLCLCDARADMPPDAAVVWPDRIAIARQDGCAGLAASTTERWFGRAFLDAHPAIAQRFTAAASATSVAGFVGCAQAIQGLDYLPHVAAIRTPTTMIVGSNDGPLPQAMQHLQGLIDGSVLELIADAGHLPNIDQPEAFNTALLRHFRRTADALA
jgi:3-oxoadipate enol-lactonase